MAAHSNWLNTDYYDVLGVAENASEKDIRRAYRTLARELHPDTNSDPVAEQRFKEVTAAHEVLGDAERRKEYDEFRRAGSFGGSSGGFGPSGPYGGTRVRVDNIDSDLGDLGSVFGDLFGGGFGSGTGFGSTRPSRPRRAGRRSERGRDLSSSLSLSFLDAVHGTTTTINLVSEASCDTCRGTGVAPGPSLADDPCLTCSGRGRVTRPRTVKVRIPAGVEDGQTIRLPERGGPGSNGGPAGDLYITVDVEPHPDFGRLCDNLTITVPVTYPELVLGTDLSVPTIDAGTVTVRVPPGTPSGRTLRVAGRGIPGTRGSLLVTLDVVVPTDPSDAERDVIEQLATVSTERPRARWEAMT